MDHAVSEPGAISDWTSTVFASLEATWFEFIHTWPKTFCYYRIQVPCFILLAFPPNSPAKKSSWTWRKQGDFLTENAKCGK